MAEKETHIASGGAIDIETLKILADQAGSGIIHIDLDEAVEGLPSRIPVLIDRATGAVRDVRPLFEHWRVFPEFKRGTAKVLTLQSFIDLTNRHKTGVSAIFADSDWRKPSLTSVIDLSLIHI